MEDFTIGIIGGTGMLGRAIAQGLMRHGGVTPGRLWLSNRSGNAGEFAGSGVTVTSDAQALVAASDVVILSVPPAQAAALQIDASDRLVISVMAGVGLARLGSLCGSGRVVRAMSSPAAEDGLAFSPWIAATRLSPEDQARVTAILGGIGQVAEVGTEDQIALFTALTGPVPGFVAFLADAMVEYAQARGCTPDLADMAVRQLFLASGQALAQGPAAADHVQGMIDYAGTTAAGLAVLRDGPLRQALFEGLDASLGRTRALDQG